MMNGRIWTATTCAAIACGMVMSLSAQNPPASSSQSSSSKAITVTGCMQRAQQAPTGTSGTAGATSSASEIKFVLTSASLSPTGAAAATSGTATSAIASEYKLDTDESKLSPHVGHKVEITGTVEQAARAEEKPAASAANAPTLKVDSIKMIAATCQ